ncbi:hypothetical protein VXJ26_27410 (plasmid) [Klebsiella pneumoniae]|nr:hypothetical protein [Klebsiella pneumoniae]
MKSSNLCGIIQALQDFVKTNAKDTQKTEKAYGEGVVAKYNGNYVTLKFDNRKIPSSLMKKIEALLESELEKNKPHKKKGPCICGAFYVLFFISG